MPNKPRKRQKESLLPLRNFLGISWSKLIFSSITISFSAGWWINSTIQGFEHKLEINRIEMQHNRDLVDQLNKGREQGLKEKNSETETLAQIVKILQDETRIKK